MVFHRRSISMSSDASEPRLGRSRSINRSTTRSSSRSRSCAWENSPPDIDLFESTSVYSEIEDSESENEKRRNGEWLWDGQEEGRKKGKEKAKELIDENYNEYQRLSHFKTVFLIDDSGSMCGLNWKHTAAALTAMIPIFTKHDSNGVDIHFLNNTCIARGLTSAWEITKLFSSSRVQPHGGTYTGKRLGDLIDFYVSEYKNCPQTKPLNIICITGGEPDDPHILAQCIARCAKVSLTDGVSFKQGSIMHFLQVGTDYDAKRALNRLETLCWEYGIGNVLAVNIMNWEQIKECNKTGSDHRYMHGFTSDAVLRAVIRALDLKTAILEPEDAPTTHTSGRINRRPRLLRKIFGPLLRIAGFTLAPPRKRDGKTIDHHHGDTFTWPQVAGVCAPLGRAKRIPTDDGREPSKPSEKRPFGLGENVPRSLVECKQKRGDRRRP